MIKPSVLEPSVVIWRLAAFLERCNGEGALYLFLLLFSGIILCIDCNQMYSFSIRLDGSWSETESQDRSVSLSLSFCIISGLN